MTTQLNKRETLPVSTKNVEKIDTIIVDKVEDSLKDLDGDIEDLNSIIEILKDRMIQSTEAAFPISLARFAEIKLATRRQKNELLKTLISYKTGEQSAKKRSNDASSSIQDIMAGVGLGAAMASGGKLNINSPTAPIEVERTDVIDAEIEVEAGETTAPSVSNLLRGL